MLGVVLALLVPLAGSASAYSTPPEGYAAYDPQTKCGKTVKPGTKVLAAWIDRSFDRGAAVASLRRCDSGGVSEHKEGRAVDWMVKAWNTQDRAAVKRFLTRLFATDKAGTPHALARRMGVMYLIWNDHIWSAYHGFEKRDYRPCAKPSRCSATARHRDHVHLSLSRAGGKGRTSWYEGRLPTP